MLYNNAVEFFFNNNSIEMSFYFTFCNNVLEYKRDT